MSVDKIISELRGIGTLLYFVFLGLFGIIYGVYIRSWDISTLAEFTIGVLLLITSVAIASYLNKSLEEAQDILEKTKRAGSKTSQE